MAASLEEISVVLSKQLVQLPTQSVIVFGASLFEPDLAYVVAYWGQGSET